MSESDLNLFVKDSTGLIVTLNKEERKLLKELLVLMRQSKVIRSFVTKRLGEDYLEVGFNLLKNLGQ